MADVFLSYASEDRRLALDVAKRLGEAGFSVWWDRYIHGGADFSAEIELRIKAAKSVIVLWSRASQSSKWVRDEAAYARDDNKLIPLQIDGTPPPLGFRQVQSIDFSGWTGAAESEPFEALIRSLGRMLDPTRASNDDAATPPSARTRSPYAQLRSLFQRRRGLFGIAAALLAGVVVSVAYLSPPPASPPQEVTRGEVEIRPFTANPPDAAGIAHAGIYADAFRSRLAEKGVRNVPAAQGVVERNSELILVGEVARDGGQEILTVRLDDRRTGSTLWSIRGPPSVGAAWEANVAAFAVKCALKRRDPERGTEMFSRYLFGCASYLDDDYRSFHSAAKAAYEAATDDPAAIAFFAASTVAVGYVETVSRTERQRLMSDARQLAERALELEPKNADALLAMGFTYDDPQYAEQERWWRAAVEADPDSELALGRYANFLSAVGRTREAMDMELRAVQARLTRRVTRPAHFFAAAGDWRQVEALYDLVRPFDPDSVASSELKTFVMYGDIYDASRMLAERPDLAGRNLACWTKLLRARRKENVDADLFNDACGGQFDSVVVFALAGDVDGAYRELERLLGSTDQYELPHLFGRPMSAVQKDPRFWPLVARTGFAAYWLETDHWPDFCAEPDFPVDCRQAARAAQSALLKTSATETAEVVPSGA